MASDDMADTSPAMPSTFNNSGIGVAENTSTQSAAGGFSTTNTQVAGVDEPDIIKTDGSRILAVAQNHLHYIDISGPEPNYRGSLALNSDEDWGYDQEIFISGNRALVFSNHHQPELLPVTQDQIQGENLSTADVIIQGNPVAVVQQVDISNPESMEVMAQLHVEGRYLSARSVGDLVWMSLSSNKIDSQFVYPSGPAAEEVAKRTNQEIAANAGLSAWLPAYQLQSPDGVSAGILPECEQLHAPTEFAGFNVLSVLSFNMSETLSKGDASAVLADGYTLYGSGESLYLAASAPVLPEPHQDAEPSFMNIDTPTEWSTTLHKFSVSAEGPAGYEASGTIAGMLVNQFAMDDHNGYFRVATTLNPWDNDSSESQLVVLEQHNQRLVEVGKVSGLGKTERIFSVRFAGDVGYVVTFRQIDPLYVLNLANPQAPSVAGELKIPGFSTYLHPLGEGLLLGIGQDADEEGRTNGTKVSLFDVSDVSRPQEVDAIIFEDAHSIAEYDHRAFLHWVPDDLAASWVAIPLEIYRYTNDFPVPERESDEAEEPNTPERFSGAVVLQISETGVTEIGRFSHHLVQTNTTSELSNEFTDIETTYVPPIERLLIAGTNLWSLSQDALQANDLLDLNYVNSFSLRSN